ncbi:MAG: TIGR02186 family protein [Sphingobium sp.]
MRAAGRLALALLALCLMGAAPQPRLVPDVSQSEVQIRYSFSGAELLLFGAILYPGGRVPDDKADIIVVLRGPSQPVVMREKRKIAGIWLNADSVEFQSAPSFYAVASSRPIRQMVDERTAAIYELGLDKLQLSPSSLNSGEEIDRFARGLNDLRVRNGLFVERAGAVSITEGVLYQARLPLSARVVVGNYTAETFLVRDGRVLAAAVREIKVRKSGLERLIGVFAERRPILYGLTAIAMALLLGMLAAFISFRL